MSCVIHRPEGPSRLWIRRSAAMSIMDSAVHFQVDVFLKHRTVSSLSLRERARVRGSSKHHPARTFNLHHPARTFNLHQLLRHKGYKTLCLYLRIRQNPPACALCPRTLSFTCHCLSVVGFSSPFGISKRTSSIQSGMPIPALDGGCAQGALGRAGFANSTGLLTCAQLPPFF